MAFNMHKENQNLDLLGFIHSITQQHILFTILTLCSEPSGVGRQSVTVLPFLFETSRAV